MLKYIIGGVVMKRKIIIAGSIVVFSILSLFLINILFTNLIERSNSACVDQTFSSAEEAMQAWENRERELNDTSLDVCPPYHIVHTFEYEAHTMVFYSYCDSFDGEKSPSYGVSVLKHNDDGTLSFHSVYTDFVLREPKGNEEYYYFTNIDTANGKKSISFLYLPKDSEKDIYVDGIKAEKILVEMEEQEFYLCYALSKPDTFLSNLFTPDISKRHKIEVK
jgi:hypothetical protein